MKTGERQGPGFHIEVGCPGCGGELEIEEDFFVTACSHCGSVLRLVMPDTPAAYMVRHGIPRPQIRFSVDRFLKAHSLPLSDGRLEYKGFYYPFWKIDALLLRLRNRLEKRVVRSDDDYQSEASVERQATEVSVVPYSLTVPGGSAVDGVPDSLGLRAGVIKLAPFSTENIGADFDVLPVTRPWGQVWQKVNRSLATVREISQPAFGANATELFHPMFSLVFFPFCVVESYKDGYRRFMVDGLTARVLECRSETGVIRDDDKAAAEASEIAPITSMTSQSRVGPLLTEPGPDSEGPPPPDVQIGSLGVEFHRCTTCGADLPNEKSCLYICRNCHETKTVDKTPLPISGVFRTQAAGGSGDRLFPFWAFKMPEADSERLRMLFGGLYASDRVVVPAFKIHNFESLYRLAGRMSAAFPRIDLSPIEEFDGNFLPASVGMAQAMGLAEVVIYRRQVEMAAKAAGRLPQKNEFRPSHAEIFFAPFHGETYFFVDSLMGTITFEQSVVG